MKNVNSLLAAIAPLHAKLDGLLIAGEILDLQTRINLWQTKTFGNQPIEDKLKHLIHEANELMAKPDDVAELVDVFILFLGTVSAMGLTLETVVECANDKVSLLETRQWERLADGTYHHTSEDSSLRRAFDHKWSLPRHAVEEQVSIALAQEWNG